MRMPTTYDGDILKSGSGTGGTIVYSIVFPSIGFFPFAGTGNGDYHGFYWPIGRENVAPIVAYSSHDAYALIPEHGNLLSATRCQLARDEDRELSYEFDAALKAANLSRPTIEFDDLVAVDDHQRFLKLDPNSPFRNCAVADQLVAEEKLDAAEVHFRKAIELLPEYGAAHYGLGYLLRRTRRAAESAIHFRKALICPLVFWGGCFWADHILPGSFRKDWARKALMWLQQLKDPGDALANDPFMQKIHDLTLATGIAESKDLEISIELVELYAAVGQFLDAIYLWITVGDRAALETTSFRERYGLTARSYGKRLANLFREAGLKERAELTDNMIAAMHKPDGLYL